MSADNSPPSPALEIHLLGQFQVRIHGHGLAESSITGRKARSLLKLIALQRNGQLVRDQAMALLWPELDETAATQLYKALHHVRRAFAQHRVEAEAWIEMTDDLIRLDPPGGLVTDVQRFEEAARAGLRGQGIADLEAAVSWYTGDLLPMDLYAEWNALPREYYRQRYLDVLVALATQYERRSRLAEAAEMLRLALEKDPLLETAHRSLMRIFARRGQTVRALRQFELFRTALRRELEIDPSPEMQATLAAVRERRLYAEAEAGAHRSTLPASIAPIINRTSECGEIDRTLDRLMAGEGGAFVVTGDVGVGKTRLVQELILRSRRRGIRVFSGGATEGRGAVAYGPFVELFEAVLQEHPDLQEALPVELGRLVPSYSGDGEPLPHADKLAAQGFLFAQVHRFFARVADEGFVVILEDLHAAEEGSRSLFQFLVRHAGPSPVLFVATVRRDARSATEIIPAIAGPTTTILDLGPLSPQEHALLLQRHGGATAVDPGRADRIFGLSEGNPLFALELLRFQANDGPSPSSGNEVAPGDLRLISPSGSIPASLRYVVEQRLAGLSPSARHLLNVAAVIGRHVPYDLMASVWSGRASHGSSSGEEALFEPLEEVMRARLLEERGLDYLFQHALVREVIYTSISEPRRRAIHSLVAGRLVAIASGEDDGSAEEIAVHFIGAREIRQGVHYLTMAAERAEAAYAHDDALKKYRQVLELLKDVHDTQAKRLKLDVHERVGDVFRASGRLEQSYDAYEEAMSLAEELPMSEPGRVELHRKIALVAIFRTEMDRSERHLARAFELVGEDERACSRLLITRALHLWHLNRLDDAYDLARQALVLAESADAGAEASQACEILAMTCLPLGRWEEGLQYEMRRQVYGWSPEVVVATDAHLCLWEYHVSGDQPFQQARSFLQRVSEQATELGDLRCVAVCHYALGTMHLWRGESERASRELEQSLNLHDRVGSPAGMAYALARTGVLNTMRGATELGWQAVQAGIAHAERAAVRDHCLQRLYGVGIWNRLEANDLLNAGILVDKSRQLLDESGACSACALELYPWLAYFHLRSGEIERARECGDAISQLAAMTGNPVGAAVAAMIDSSLSAAEQDDEHARTRREEAFALAGKTVTEAMHSPVVHYLDRMLDLQSTLRGALM